MRSSAEALATAGRAATSRTGTLPVLSGLRLEVHGDELSVTGTDLELSIRLTIAVGGDRDGAVVVPARLVRRHRALAAGRRGRGGVGRRRGEHQRRSFAVLDPPARSRRLPGAGRAGRRGRHAVVGRRRRRAAPGRARRQHRRRPGGAHRRAAHRPRTTACAWSPPTRTGWRSATCPTARCSASGQKVLVPEPRAERAAARARRRRGAAGAARRARRGVRVGRHAADDPADRGRVPELPQPAAAVVTRTCSPSAARRCSRRCAA